MSERRPSDLQHFDDFVIASRLPLQALDSPFVPALPETPPVALPVETFPVRRQALPPCSPASQNPPDEKLLARIRDLEANLTELQELPARLKAAQERERSLAQELTAHRSRSEAWARSLNTLTARYTQVTAAYEKLRAAYSQKQTQAEFDLKMGESVRQFNDQRVRQLQEALDTRTAECENLKAELERARGTDYEHKLEWRSRQTEAELHNRTLSERLSTVSAELETHRKLLADQRQAHEKALAAEREKLEQAVRQERERHAALKKLLEEEQKDKHLLLESLRSAELRIEETEKRLAGFSLELSASRPDPVRRRRAHPPLPDQGSRPGPIEAALRRSLEESRNLSPSLPMSEAERLSNRYVVGLPDADSEAASQDLY